MLAPNLTFQQKGLVQQGYKDLSPDELRSLEWGLRFTPAACSILTLVGIVYGWPYLLLGVSALGIWAFVAPGAHPMDLLYNHGVRHLFGGVKLPPNPFQRRLACFAAGVMNATAAGLLLAGYPTPAKVVVGALLVLQMIVITTHFCTLSWIYELLLKSVGQWSRPIDAEQVGVLLKNGATLIDVREVNEFQRGHLEGALNLPLSQISGKVDSLDGQVCLLYCASGMRSQRASKMLQQFGHAEVHDLGGINRARRLVESQR